MRIFSILYSLCISMDVVIEIHYKEKEINEERKKNCATTYLYLAWVVAYLVGESLYSQY